MTKKRRDTFRNSKTPLQQHSKLTKDVAGNIESFLFHESALHQANPNWQIRTTYKNYETRIYKDGKLLEQSDGFKKLLEDFLDAEIKKYAYLIDPEMNPDPDGQFYERDISQSNFYGFTILKVDFEINGENFSKYYHYDEDGIYCCIDIKDIIGIKSTPVIKSIPLLHKYLLRAWTTSTNEFVTDNLKPIPRIVQKCDLNRKIFTLINTVYMEENQNLNNTIHQIIRYIHADMNNDTDTDNDIA
jgi:hypothetical protein